MNQFAIRCLPRVPVAGEELERWLERELEELRDDIPQGTIRVRLASMLRDLRLLGFQPTLLAPSSAPGFQTSGPTSSQGASPTALETADLG